MTARAAFPLMVRVLLVPGKLCWVASAVYFAMRADFFYCSFSRLCSTARYIDCTYNYTEGIREWLLAHR
jgi:hypothetical protein